MILFSSSRSGLAPDVLRLVEKILVERRHLPTGSPSLILVDLKMWGDFQYADHYLEEVAKELKKHRLPAFVGTFIAPLADADPLERCALHVEDAWLQTPVGVRFYTDWWGRQLKPATS